MKYANGKTMMLQGRSSNEKHNPSDTPWWFRNPKANHRLDGAKNLVNTGVNYQPQLVKDQIISTGTVWVKNLR